MALGGDQSDQDALAAEWGLALEADAANAGKVPSAERDLSQEEIHTLVGSSLAAVSVNDNSGIRAIIDSAMVAYERLPMLEIVFDRLVRLMTTSLRNFTSDNVE